MKCSDFMKELADFIDEDVDAIARAELTEHLQSCHNCSVICYTTKRTIEMYRHRQLYELPHDLRMRLHGAIERKRHETQS